MKLNDMMAPPPVHLPVFEEAEAARADGASAEDVVRACPRDSAAWADLAEQALAEGEEIRAYAFARTGYHRGLDLLRGNGWKGFGAIPWSHEGNRGVLRAFAALAKAARAIGEDDEFDRMMALLRDSDESAIGALGL
nr:DUF3151 domain-containing protein [Corynebacterium lactis]